MNIGKTIRTAQQNAATLILRRMGFPARDSFDLHCAMLKAAINQNDNNAEVENSGGSLDNRANSCGRRFATMLAAFFGDGLNIVSREEFDAHCQILAAAEARRNTTGAAK